MSLMFAIYFIGQKFGGVTTILLENYNLFTPLLAGAALNAIAFIPLVYLMVEPNEVFINKDEESDEERSDNDGFKVPETLNKPLVSGLCFISILDDIGGNGIFPLTMTPVSDRWLRSMHLVADMKWLTFMVHVLFHSLPSMSFTVILWR